MTELERKILDRVREKLPDRAETYSDTWAAAARAAYPHHKGHHKADSLVMVTPGARVEATKLPALEIDFDGPKPGVDFALAEVNQIAIRLDSDDFFERQKASERLGEVLRAEIAGNKPSAALQKIFQLAGSKLPEVKDRVNRVLNATFDEAMDSKDLAGLKQLLTHREGAVQDWAVKKLQDSPKLVETLPKLASMAEKEKTTDLAEAIRKVAEPIDKKVLFEDFLLDGEFGKEWKIIFRKAAFIKLSDMDEQERADAIKQILTQVKWAVKEADDMQDSDLGALARILNTADKRKSSGSDMPNLVQAAPFESRTLTSRALVLMAQELKDAKKDPKAVDALQAAAIALYRDSLYLPEIDAAYNRVWRDSWKGAPLKAMRDLNPEQFDRLAAD